MTLASEDGRIRPTFQVSRRTSKRREPVTEPTEPASSAGDTLPPAPWLGALRGQLRPALLSVPVLTFLTGVLFPLALAAVARPAFPHQAGGSLISRDGVVVGSELIGQDFSAPGYFHPRPSAAGAGYDPLASGGT